MLNTKTINNEYWVNAKISINSKYEIYPTAFANWHSGIWYDGTWNVGNFNYSKYSNWLNGIWIDGWILDTQRWSHKNISPKSYLRPINTLSLNYAKYD